MYLHWGASVKHFCGLGDLQKTAEGAPPGENSAASQIKRQAVTLCGF